MPRTPLPYENLGGEALDNFGELLAWIFLCAILLILLLVVIWVLLKALQRAGVYRPTGPLDEHMGRLMVLAVLVVIMGGAVAMFFYWFLLDPSPEWPPRLR